MPIGKADSKHHKMHEACIEALKNCENKLKPGNNLGEVFDIHAKTLDDLGYNKSRMNACGYSLGNTFSPNWMDWPMLYTCLLYTSPSPRDLSTSRMPSSA